MTEKLDSEVILSQMKSIHADWLLNESMDQIHRDFHFKNYYQTMAFANGVAWIAHQMDHHPELTISYNRCKVEYSTHSVNGLSMLDFKSASAVDQLVNSD